MAYRWSKTPRRGSSEEPETSRLTRTLRTEIQPAEPVGEDTRIAEAETHEEDEGFPRLLWRMSPVGKKAAGLHDTSRVQ
jgi:hypothetical protein